MDKDWMEAGVKNMKVTYKRETANKEMRCDRCRNEFKRDAHIFELWNDETKREFESAFPNHEYPPMEYAFCDDCIRWALLWILERAGILNSRESHTWYLANVVMAPEHIRRTSHPEVQK